MLSKLKKTQSEGFTIIEVMIVLAIAALILLIVLLAVPALQRNSRNTTIKNDVGVIAGLVNTAVSNSDGAPVTAVTGGGGTVNVTDSTPETGKISGGTTITPVTAVPTSATNSTINVWTGHDCTGAANTRVVALWYPVENSGTTVLKCQQA